ncbi:MAG: phosphoribosylamine--glycine ligase [Rhodospirillales bacterium]|nr:phosphoribosylamine--glycine ligase [Rhodospirillales bacterium]
MNILVVGGGGREHALSWKLAQSRLCSALYAAPGNAGICESSECNGIAADNIDEIVAFAQDRKIDLVVIGPEVPLVAGLTDILKEKGFKVFGPSRAAAQLEGSKAFMKDMCAKYGIPTAAYGRFTDLDAARTFIRTHGAPIVVKTDGLAAGKGVIICQSVEEAEKAAEEMLSGAAFGDAGTEIVIEEFLEGEEVSFFALADGKTVVPLLSAQDHKRVGDGDMGLNTGGMGAYAPAHFMTPELEKEIFDRTIKPLIDGMAKEGCPFTGVLFAGLMVKDCEPTLLEYNVRFGDPECQPLMMLLKSDLLEILLAAAEGRLDEVADQIEWRNATALCVVMAAKGYPGDYEKGSVIDLDHAESETEHCKIFHAGTCRNGEGQLVANGGRVLGVTALGNTAKLAQERAYHAVDLIDWPDGFCRRDIGWRAVKSEGES